VVIYHGRSVGSVEGSLKMLVRPGDKCYEIKLRGSCTADEGLLKNEGQLLTSAQAVFWGGVAVGATKMEKFFLENVYKHDVELRLTIKDSVSSDFQLQSDSLQPHYSSSQIMTLSPKVLWSCDTSLCRVYFYKYKENY